MRKGPDEGRPHKPFLIDPAEEGMKPQGVDGTWWAYLFSGWAQRVLPKRFRGLPPLFYLPALGGILWGATFLFFRMSRLPIPTGMTLEPAPPLPNTALDVTTILMAALGILQGMGTLYRRQWGLTVVYAWFVLTILFGWLAFGTLRNESQAGPIHLLVVLGNTVTGLAFIIYYRNRSGWFGVFTQQ
ncbi:MAG: hypothetical protein JSV79_09620 [Armatimonadota bacterium]|nr:MAG: hypothetical protein JSV79_09620 [Armatimonadota bacterium]